MSEEEEEEEGAGPVTKKSKSASRRLVGPDFAVLFPEVVTVTTVTRQLCYVFKIFV